MWSEFSQRLKSVESLLEEVDRKASKARSVVDSDVDNLISVEVESESHAAAPLQEAISTHPEFSAFESLQWSSESEIEPVPVVNEVDARVTTSDTQVSRLLSENATLKARLDDLEREYREYQSRAQKVLLQHPTDASSTEGASFLAALSSQLATLRAERASSRLELVELQRETQQLREHLLELKDEMSSRVASAEAKLVDARTVAHADKVKLEEKVEDLQRKLSLSEAKEANSSKQLKEARLLSDQHLHIIQSLQSSLVQLQSTAQLEDHRKPDNIIELTDRVAVQQTEIDRLRRALNSATAEIDTLRRLTDNPSVSIPIETHGVKKNASKDLILSFAKFFPRTASAKAVSLLYVVILQLAFFFLLTKYITTI